MANDLPEVDLSKTRAVINRGGYVTINLKGRFKDGIVDPADKGALEEQIIDDLYNYRDPITGRRVVALAFRNKDAVAVGLGGERCGDVICLWQKDSTSFIWIL